MAQVRWYLNASLLDGWALVDQTAAAAATLTSGWVVGTGLTNSSEFQSAGGDRASTTFVGNTVPDGTLDTTLKDAFRSQYPNTGSFAAGNWTFQFAVVSTVQSGAADGQIVFRVLKADANGANATQITTAQQVTTTATNVAGTDVNISATWAAPAFTITNQYLFIQVAWKRTGAGGMTTTNIRLRTGSSTTVGTTGLTADFTAAVTGATIPSGSSFGAVSAVRQKTPFTFQTTSSQTSMTGITFPTLPTVGNGIVVLAALGSAVSGTCTCTDNQGHTYVLAKGQAESLGGAGWAGIFYLSAITASSGTFTLTLTVPSGFGFFAARAFELSTAGFGLTLDTTASATASSASPATGATAALAANTSFQAATFSMFSAGTTITVGAQTPAWDEEYDQNLAVLYRSEGNTRIVTGATGSTPSCSWTTNVGDYWAAVIATFVMKPQMCPPGVAVVGADQGVTTEPIASTVVINQPTVAPGPVAVTTVAVATTLSVNEPAIAPGPVTVTGETIASTLTLTVPEVTPGDVTVTTNFLNTSSSTFAPEVVGGDVGPSLLDDLAAWWEFEGTGLADSHGSNTLTNVGSATFTAGKIGNAFQCGSAGTYLQCANNAALDQGDNYFSLAGWAYVSASGGSTRILMSKWTDGTRAEWQIGSSTTNGRFFISVGNGSTTQVGQVVATTFGTIAINTWYFIACGHDPVANLVWISVNGGAIDTSATTAAVANSIEPILFGRRGGGSTPLYLASGSKLDQWGYWMRDIRSDIADLYNSGAGRDYASLGTPSTPTIGGAHCASTAVLYAPTVVGGILGITTAFYDARAQLSAPVLVARASNLSTNMVGHWPFDEASSSAIDQHSTNDLTKVGTIGGQQAPIDGTPARKTEAGATYGAFSVTTNAELEFNSDQAYTFILRCTFDTGADAEGFLWIVNKGVTNGGAPHDVQLYWAFGGGFHVQQTYVGGGNTGATDMGPGNAWQSALPTGTVVIAFGHDPVAQKVWLRINGRTRVESGAVDTRNSVGGVLAVGINATTGTEALKGAVGPLTYWKRSLVDSEIDYWTSAKGDYAAITFTQSVAVEHCVSTLVYAPSVSGGTVGGTQAITTSPITGVSVDDLLLEDGGFALLEDGGHLLLDVSVGVAQTFAPTVDTSQTVTSAHIASTVVLSAPTVVPGAVTVTGAFIEPDLDNYSWLTQFPAIESVQSEGLTGGVDAWGTYLGQEFKVGSVETLTAIDLRIRYSLGGTPATDNLYVEIRMGGRNGAVLGTSTPVPAASLGFVPSNFGTFNFSTPITLTPGTLYAWVAKRDSWESGLTLRGDYYNRAAYPPGRVQTAHSMLVWDGSADPPGWYDYATDATPAQLGYAGFEYRLHYAVGVFAPTVAPGPVAVTTDFIGFIATDNFNRANEDPLSNGWAAAPAVVAGQLRIVGDAATTPTAASGGSYWTTIQPTDFSVSVQVAWLAANNAANIQLLVNPAVAPRNGFQLLLQRDTLGTTYYLSVLTVTSGSATSLIAQTVIAMEPNGGIGIKRSGTTIEVWWRTARGNWTLMTSATSALHAVGLYASLNGSVTTVFDNFVTGPMVRGSGALAFAPTVKPEPAIVTPRPIGMGPGTATITENFNRADEASLVGNWTTATVSSATGLVLSSNTVTSPATTPWIGASYWNPSADPANFSRSVEIPAANTADANAIVAIEMLTSPTAAPKNGYAVTVQRFSGTPWVRVHRIDNGVVGAVVVAYTSTAMTADGAIGFTRNGYVIEGWYRVSAASAWISFGRGIDTVHAGALWATLSVTNGTNFATTKYTADNFGTAPALVIVGASVFTPTVAAGAVTVTGSHIPTAQQLFIPSVSTDAVTVGDVHLATTTVLNPPTVQALVTGATIVSSTALFVPSVATTLTTSTIPATTQLFTPLVGAGVITGTIPSALVLHALTVAAGPVPVTTAFISSASIVRVPSVAPGAVTLSGVHIASAAIINAPSVVAGPVAVTTPGRPTTIQVFAPTVAPGPVTVGGATRLSTLQVFTPSVAVGAVAVTTGTVGITTQVRVPIVTVGPVSVTGSTIPSAQQLFTASITVGATAVSTPAWVVSTALFLLSVTAVPAGSLGLTHIATTEVLSPPTVAVTAVSVTGQHVASTLNLFLPSISNPLPQAVTTQPAASTASRFAPSVATGPVTVVGGTRVSALALYAPSVVQTVTTAHRPTTIQAFTPTVATGPVIVIAAHIGSTVQLSLPAVTVGGTLVGPAFIGSTLQVYAPSLTAGPVSVGGGTVALTSQVFLPTVEVGVTSVSGGHRPAATVLYPPSFVARLDGTFIASGAVLYAPTVKITQFVTTVPITSGVAPFAPSVLALWAVGGATRPSTVLLFAPSVAVGPVTITGSTVPSPALLYPPTVLVGPVSVTAAHVASTRVLFAPIVGVAVFPAHIGSTGQVFALTVAPGPVAVQTAPLLSTLQVFAPTLGAGVTGGFVASTTLPYAPTLVPVVTTPLWVVSTVVYDPGVSTLGEMFAQHIPSGSLLYPPMAAEAADSEILDFVSNIVTAVSGNVNVCCSVSGTVILTRGVAMGAELERVVNMSPSLIRREFAVGVER